MHIFNLSRSPTAANPQLLTGPPDSHEPAEAALPADVVATNQDSNRAPETNRLKRWGMLHCLTAGLGLSTTIGAGTSMYNVGRSVGRNLERQRFCQNPVKSAAGVCHTYTTEPPAPTWPDATSIGAFSEVDTANTNSTRICGGGIYKAKPDLVPYIDAVVSYLELSRSGQEFLAKVREKLSPIEVHYNGVTDHFQSTAYAADGNTTSSGLKIVWDRRSKHVFRENSVTDTATSYEKGCLGNSAASDLVHETSHAYNSAINPMGKIFKDLVSHPMYDNFEERDAILNTNRIIVELSEPSRSDNLSLRVLTNNIFDHSAAEACSDDLHSATSRLKGDLAPRLTLPLSQNDNIESRSKMLSTLSAAKNSDPQIIDLISTLFEQHGVVLDDFSNHVKLGGSLLDFDKRYAKHITDIDDAARALEALVPPPNDL